MGGCSIILRPFNCTKMSTRSVQVNPIESTINACFMAVLLIVQIAVVDANPAARVTLVLSSWVIRMVLLQSTT